MSAVVILSLVALAAIFFVLSIIFHAIGSIMDALKITLFILLKGLGAAVLLFIFLQLIVGLIAYWGNLWEFIGMLLLMGVILLIAAGVIFKLGGLIFELIGLILIVIIVWIYETAEIIAEKCEDIFEYFLCVINDKLR